jgi:hypothetical protein
VAQPYGDVVSRYGDLCQLRMGGHRSRVWRGLAVDDLRGLVLELDPNTVGQLGPELPGAKVVLQRLACCVCTAVVRLRPRLQGPLIETTAKLSQIALPGSSPREVMALLQRAKLIAESFNAWIPHSRAVCLPRAMPALVSTWLAQGLAPGH